MGGIKRDSLDQAFSLYVRTKAGKCEYCHQIKEPKRLHCSHYFGRRKRSVRCDEDNVASLCPACHFYLGENPHKHTEWFKKRLGDKYDELVTKANTIVKVTKKEKLELAKVYRERLKEL